VLGVVIDDKVGEDEAEFDGETWADIDFDFDFVDELWGVLDNSFDAKTSDEGVADFVSAAGVKEVEIITEL